MTGHVITVLPSIIALMKILPLIAVFSILSLTTSAQFNFESDSAASEELLIELPNFDSIKFEVRLWSFPSWFYPTFTQLTFDIHDNWNYRRGFIDWEDSVTFIPRINPEPNIEELWIKIDSLGLRTLQTQMEVTAQIEKDGKVYKLTKEQLYKFIATDATTYVVELFNKDGFRTYSYIEPLLLSKKFSQAQVNWVAPEHHQMAAIVTEFYEAFDGDDLTKRVIEHWKNNKKQGN